MRDLIKKISKSIIAIPPTTAKTRRGPATKTNNKKYKK